MSQNELVEFVVQVGLIDSDDEEVDLEARRLRSEVINLTAVE